MKIPESTIQEISRRIDTLGLVGEYIQLKKKGTRYWGLCPFHEEKSPSFTVTPEKSMYYCFGCHKGGNIFSFVMEMEKLSFVEAVRLLAKKANVEITLENDGIKRETRDSLVELYNRLTATFHHMLLKENAGKAALDYLVNRGMDSSTVESFRLGYAPAARDWLSNLLVKKNYSREFLATSGLFTIRDGNLIPYFYDRIVFPIANAGGDVIAFGGRTMKEGPPKYLNSPETAIFKKGDNLFGIDHAIDAIKKTGCFCIVEGYIDVLAMHQAGITYCVAPLGTALTENQARYLKRYASRGLLVFDGDEAGIKAAIKGVETLERQNIEQEIVEPPDGDDPADILQKYGKERLNNLLKYSIKGFQYLLTKALKKYDVATPSGKEDIFRFLFSYLEKIDSSIKLEGYLSLVADGIGIDVESVRKEFYKKTGLSLQRIKRSEPANPAAREIADELFLMLAITAHREYFPYARTLLSTEMLTDEKAKELYIALEECYREEKTSIESLLEKIEDKELCDLVIKKASSSEFDLNTEKIVQDGVSKIKRKTLEKRCEEIQLQIHKLYKTEPWKIDDLLVEKKVLDKEIEKLKVNDDARVRK